MSKIKLNKSNHELIAIFTALREMNGAVHVVHDAAIGKDVAVRVPYLFTSQVTLTMARNLRLLTNVISDYNSAVKLANSDQDDLRDAKVEVELEQIPYASLRVGFGSDENRIPAGNISQLLPILLIEQPPVVAK